MFDLHRHLSGSIPGRFSVNTTMRLRDYLGAPFRSIEQEHASATAFKRDVLLATADVDCYTEIRLNAVRRVNSGLPIEAMKEALSLQNVYFILTLSREDGVESYRDAVRLLDQSRGLFVGVDLAGMEEPDQHELNPTWLDWTARFFRDCQQEGLGVTYHVGETGSLRSVLLAYEAIRMNRIGHGLALHKATDDELRQLNVSIELCPTANLKTGTATKEYLRGFLEKLIRCQTKFCFNTDSPSFLITSLAEEYALGEAMVAGSSELSSANSKTMRFVKASQ